jgi:membrane protease YdiL (CAAX protease family)
VATEAVSAENTTTNRAPSARRDLLELAIGYLLIMATIWSANPTQRVFYWLAFVWIVGTTLARRDNWTTLGLGRKGLLQSLWVIGAALILSAAAILIAWQTHTLHRLHGPAPLPLHGWAYIIWALMQQFILQSYFLLRLLRLLPGKALPILVATGIFALAHLPNPILTPLTFIWGAIACVLFLRYRNIYTLGIAHGIMGLCVAITVPNSLQRHMRVGLGYLRYHPRTPDRHLSSSCRHPDPERAERAEGEGPLYFVVACSGPWHHRSQSDQSVSTDACVIADAPTRRS